MVDIVLLLETKVNRPHPTDGSVATLSRQDQLDHYFCTLTSFKQYPIGCHLRGPFGWSASVFLAGSEYQSADRAYSLQALPHCIGRTPVANSTMPAEFALFLI